MQCPIDEQHVWLQCLTVAPMACLSVPAMKLSAPTSHSTVTVYSAVQTPVMRFSKTAVSIISS